MGYYKDLREHIGALEANNKLVRIRREINKDTELIPLVRWQFRGLPEEERKAFLFEQVVDVKGKRYSIPVLVASHGACKEVYAIGMMCKPEEIGGRWSQATLHPVEPRLVESGPVHEEVHRGDNLLEHGGLEEFPIPITTPGFDNAPYITAGSWVTKDPETGIRNVGVYRGMVKSRTRLGINALTPQHLRVHWEKCRARGMPLESAIIIGATPNITFTAVTKIPYGTDEYTIAGGIAGEPVELVKCKTVNLEVPATAEIVIEGRLPTDALEEEGPYGEHPGYVGVVTQFVPYFEVTCITHRKNPIDNVIMNQFPPSEDSKIMLIAAENIVYNFLKYNCNIPGILDVAFHENSGGKQFVVIRMRKTYSTEPWQALNAAVAFNPTWAKMIIVVDEDIDPRDTDSIIWALCYRMQPHLDIRITPGKTAALDPSAAPLKETMGTRERPPTSSLLIDATRKWDYPPVSLPKRELMERARQIWEEEGLPKLSPKVPWYGYSLGHWSKENEEEAELALKGEHYQTGEKLARNRITI